MHKTGWYIDLRIVFTHSFEHEIPNLVFNLVSLEKKFGAIVSWVLKLWPPWKLQGAEASNPHWSPHVGDTQRPQMVQRRPVS